MFKYHLQFYWFMKKGVLFVLLLASIAFAQVNVPYDSTYPNAPAMGITRYSDFPLDNIHILRLQEAATSLGGNVSLLKADLEQYNAGHKASQAQLDMKLSSIQAAMDQFQRTVLAQLSSMQNSRDSISGLAVASPDVQVPAQTSFPPTLVALLGLNVFLLLVVIILIFWLREQYYVHKETHKEDHIHPAPQDLINYVAHQLEHKRTVHEIRMELANKGWTPSVIEHAIHAARER